MADQGNFRSLAIKFDGLLHGASRALQESFTTYVARRDELRPIPIRAPLWCYYADPFPVRYCGRDWLFVERMDYRSNRGQLCALPLDDDLRAGPCVQILPRSRHASFPLAFEEQGALYLLPETNADRSVDLFVCRDFPAQWVRVERLLEDVQAIDSVLMCHEGLWWLITSQIEAAESRQPFLAIYFSETLLGGRWHSHPVTKERIYQDRSFSSMRNAGPPIFHDGQWLRPVQRNTHYYGEALGFMRIERMTPTTYSESEHELSPFPLLKSHLASAHHVAATSELVVFDRRTRARSFLGLHPLGPTHIS